MKILNKLRQINNKPLLFAIYGALGCLLAALLLGEPFFALFPPASPPAQALVLLIDTSGSMGGDKLSEVKNAAIAFVERQDLTRDEIAVIGFSSDIQLGSTLTNNREALQYAIDNLNDGGGTLMDQGINAAVEQLENSLSTKKNILLFTDGQPGYAGADVNEEIEKTLMAGNNARDEQIKILAIATGDADIYFLQDLTQDPDLVFFVDSGGFNEAFKNAQTAINSLISSSGEAGDYNSLFKSLVIIGVWTGFIGIGVCLALIIGQNHYCHRRLISQKELWLGVGGGFIAGLVAGILTQLAFALVSQFPALITISRLLAWTILGVIIGAGTSLVIPNLKPIRGILGGGLGGFIGCLGFITVLYLVSLGTPSRLLGMTILGFFLGLMIALIEQISRQASVLVHWGPKEKTVLSLGEKAVILGSSPDAHIYLRKDHGYPPVTGKIYQQGDKIYLEFDPAYAEQKSMKKFKQELKSGDMRKFDQLSFEVQLINSNLQKVT
ncbi:VWA domain-containing protein [Synechocystis sp. PCC 7339]|uniref:VWA domain-containing protein n=1 Tax=Synechocystis sp. PCC 7339 TaxID=2782213 RepID=UPI001CBE3F68|nr:VWA domain-containing protein [Synechocystis sp. PCC 7339]UAJ72060.1 VWA domain-containing protein [Synechocystis sp. PCC 7339]